MGFSMESANPRAAVLDDIPMVKFDCVLKFENKTIYQGDYCLGVGNLKITQPIINRLRRSDLVSAANTLMANPQARLRDRLLHAELAAEIARITSYEVELEAFIHCLFVEGRIFFEAVGFEDFCHEFEYSIDSMKAKKIWSEADRIGRTLTRALGAEKIKEVGEMLY